MITLDDRYEVKGGQVFVNREAIPLRRGILYAALARAGWDGTDGPVDRRFIEKLLRADRRISLYLRDPATNSIVS